MHLVPDRGTAGDLEEPLAGGNMAREVRRVGTTVQRWAGPWTPAVHRLLRHLEQLGFGGAPRALGIDARERDILTYVPGRVVHPNVLDDSELARVARLIARPPPVGSCATRLQLRATLARAHQGHASLSRVL
jgi:hypothetical protein